MIGLSPSLFHFTSSYPPITFTSFTYASLGWTRREGVGGDHWSAVSAVLGAMQGEIGCVLPDFPGSVV